MELMPQRLSIFSNLPNFSCNKKSSAEMNSVRIWKGEIALHRRRIMASHSASYLIRAGWFTKYRCSLIWWEKPCANWSDSMPKIRPVSEATMRAGCLFWMLFWNLLRGLMPGSFEASSISRYESVPCVLWRSTGRTILVFSIIVSIIHSTVHVYCITVLGVKVSVILLDEVLSAWGRCRMQELHHHILPCQYPRSLCKAMHPYIYISMCVLTTLYMYCCETKGKSKPRFEWR